MSIEKQIERFIGEERYEEALSLCETAKANNEITYSIEVQHARILHELYRYQEAFAVVKTLNPSEESLITEAAIIIDWVSDFRYGNYEAPPCKFDEFAKRAIVTCERLIDESKLYRIAAMYYKANALSAISQITESRLLFHQVIDSTQTDQHLLARAIINLGNSYLQEGRFLEAIEIYERAIRQTPNFSMGWSGLGSGLSHAFYQTARQEVCLLYMALFCFGRAEELVDPQKVRYVNAAQKGREHILSGFKEKPKKEDIAEWNPLQEKQTASCKSVSFKDLFFKFSLENSLFLNLCLGCRKDHSYYHDTLSIGGITSKIEDCRTPYNLFSYISEIRRDYFVSRWLYIKSQYKDDKEINFLNSVYEEVDLLDYSSGDLRQELLKISLQKSVGILDKIAFFLNEYECLNVPHRNVWFSTKKGRKTDIFEHLEKKHVSLDTNNLRNLRALRSLSTDLKHPYFEKCKTLRDSITHKYLKVHLDLVSSIERLYYPGNCEKIIHSTQEAHDDKINPKDYHITETELNDICLRTLKMSRAAIFYLTGHVRCGELDKRMNKPDKIVPSLYFDNILKPKHCGDERRK